MSSNAEPVHPDHVSLLFSKIQPLIGTWVGIGKGKFPTIDSFTYREQLRIWSREHEPYLLYEQSADIIDEAGNAVRPSHWESGVIRPLEDGTIEISNVQNSGRVEVLTGKTELGDSLDKFSLEFWHKILENDQRMVKSSRRFDLEGNTLRYEMCMATSKVSDLTFHLEAFLKRHTA